VRAPVDRRCFLGLLGAGAAGALGLAACSEGSSSGAAGGSGPTSRSSRSSRAARREPVPPASGWDTADPASVGWDPPALQAALDFAGAHGTRALVVAVGGRVIAQQAWGVSIDGFARDVASCQKSVVALLVGNLQDAGRLAIDEPVTTYLGAGWTRATPGEEAPITVRHLLTMTSGLADDLTFAAPPGTVWRYTTNAYQQLVPLVEEVSGRSIDESTRVALFDPIGVSRASRWQVRRIEGPFGVDPTGRRIQGLVMTAPDLARVGLLVLRDGTWGARRVLADRSYLAEALAPSQELNPSYGYLWWLNGQDAFVLPGPPVRRPGPLIPGAPADLVAALGKDDQKLYVVPSLEAVVTRLGAPADPSRGPRPARSSFDAELWQRLVAAAPARSSVT
jgi:CubicO group peptidase (beta-lactamase class C family)